MTDDDLAIEPQSRVDETRLAVAMCGLVQVQRNPCRSHSKVDPD